MSWSGIPGRKPCLRHVVLGFFFYNHLNSEIHKAIERSINTLSFWRIESLDEIDKAVLALAASSNSKHIEKIDVVCIPEEEIRSSSIEMNEDSPGDTIVSDLVELHRDLCSINYQTLGVISSLINNYMHRDLHKKFSRKQVKDYLLQAYRDNRICKDMCNDSLLSEIEAMV